MQWADVTRTPSRRVLRQFAGLWLVLVLAGTILRWSGGHQGLWALVLGLLGTTIGLLGLAEPAVVRPVYTGWMIAAYPIGWTVSRLLLGLIFFGLITPIAWVFRLTGRDALQRRRSARQTYWKNRPEPGSMADYFRQF